MEAEKANYPVLRMARLLRVSRSGFYAWRKRVRSEATARAARRVDLDMKVRKAHAKSYGTYGAPRIRAELARNGTGVDRKTVAVSMRRQGLEGISPRRFRPVAPIGETRVHSIPDLVARKWDTGVLDAVWISDITYLRTGEGWVYLCAVRDGCSRRVIGWAMDSAQTARLVERALRMAYVLRGTQYTSTQLNDVCDRLGIRQSVGRTGVCWDNAKQESFWSTLKTEFYDRQRWATRKDAIRATGRWIEEFYDRVRLHSALGYNTPVEHELLLTTTQPQPAQAA
jgi:transposase InsO family protein